MNVQFVLQRRYIRWICARACNFYSYTNVRVTRGTSYFVFVTLSILCVCTFEDEVTVSSAVMFKTPEQAFGGSIPVKTFQDLDIPVIHYLLPPPK